MTLQDLLQDKKASEEILEKVKGAKDDEEVNFILLQEIDKLGIKTNKEEIESLFEKLPLSEKDLEEINGGAYGIDIHPVKFPQKLLKLLVASKNKKIR